MKAYSKNIVMLLHIDIWIPYRKASEGSGRNESLSVLGGQLWMSSSFMSVCISVGTMLFAKLFPDVFF
jgi:hypothetical protein